MDQIGSLPHRGFQAAHLEMRMALKKLQNVLVRRRVECIPMSVILGAGALEGGVSDGLHVSPQEQKTDRSDSSRSPESESSLRKCRRYSANASHPKSNIERHNA